MSWTQHTHCLPPRRSARSQPNAPNVDLVADSSPQVYFVVALFRAAEPRIMEAASRGLSLVPLLVRGEALEGFDLEASLPFMEGLEQRHRHRHRCLPATRALLAQ